MSKSEISRKSFLKLIGVSSAALSISGFDFLSGDQASALIGIQLYTIRKEIEKDFERSVKKIADMGFEGVETYFLPEQISLKDAGKLLKKLQLKVLAMHCEIPKGDQEDILLRMAEAYDSDRAVYHGWPAEGKYDSLEAAKRTVEIYNEASSFCKKNGLKFGLHNHWWEFQEIDGIIPFYYLLENLDPDIFFEIDTYWTKTAGLDPARVVKDFGKRAPLLHIKDGPAPAGKPVHQHVPLGEGTLDFPAIVKAADGATEWMIVEFDESDYEIFGAVQKSYEYLTKNNLAKGKI